MKYDPTKIEKKWQKYWEQKKFYLTKDKVKGKKNHYFLVEFPYPSGNLHIGHWYAFSVTDIAVRHLRMNGKNVMYPIGFDAFGLPAENAAIKRNLQPGDWTNRNIAYMSRQLKSMGAAFDWSREVRTSDPEYYKWTQWIFLQFYKKGLAYRAQTLVNWCPKDKTVLANEQVIAKDGREVCERCGTEVVQRELFQWMFKTTHYAEKLLQGLDKVDWPEVTKTAQKNWIGKSEGAEIDFRVDGSDEKIKVFTTRADTLFGVTYVVLAPEHPLVSKLVPEGNKAEVEKYKLEAKKKSEHERTLEKEKTGVFAGFCAINPINGEKVQVWIADYVVGTYGTGAVMAVPAHDERDFEFAKKFGLPMTQVIKKINIPARSYLMGAEKITDDDLRKLGIKIFERLKDGDRKIEIPARALNDYERLIAGKIDPGFWNEYIGEDIVFIFKHGDGNTERLVLTKNTAERINKLAGDFAGAKFISPWKMLAENSWYSDLIVHQDDGNLINSKEFNGLDSAKAREEIVAKLASQGMAVKKVNYKLHDWVLSRQRYWGVPIPMIHCQSCGYQPVSDKELPIKLPKLSDYKPSEDGRSPLAKAEKWVRTKCPKCGGKAERETDTMDTFVDSSWYFLRYTDPKNKRVFADKAKMTSWLPVNLYVGGTEHNTMHLLYSRFFIKALHDLKLVRFDEPFTQRINHGIILGPDSQKMSKSRGNVIDPDDLVARFGADTVRMHLAFMGPYDQGGPWNPGGINGVYRFLSRVYEIGQSLKQNQKTAKGKVPLELKSSLEKTIKKVGDDIAGFKFNTAISAMMTHLNRMEDLVSAKSGGDLIKEFEKFVVILAPLAPHLAEEIWQNVLKHKKSIHLEKWPKFNPKLIVESSVNIVVQVNGKTRGTLSVPVDTDEIRTKEAVYGDSKLTKYLDGFAVKKVFFVKNRLINFVI